MKRKKTKTTMDNMQSIKDNVKPYEAMYNEMFPREQLLKELEQIKTNIRESKEEEQKEHLPWRSRMYNTMPESEREKRRSKMLGHWRKQREQFA